MNDARRQAVIRSIQRMVEAYDEDALGRRLWTLPFERAGIGTRAEVLEAMLEMTAQGLLDARVIVHCAQGHYITEWSSPSSVEQYPIPCPECAAEEIEDYGDGLTEMSFGVTPMWRAEIEKVRRGKALGRRPSSSTEFRATG